MKIFISHINHKSSKFLRTEAGSVNSETGFTGVVKNKINPLVDKYKLEQLATVLDKSYQDFLNFYQNFDGVDLYIQQKLPVISFYPLKECKTKNKLLKKWFLQFEPEAVNKIKSKGIAFGEVGSPSNQLIFENGQIIYAQWWGETIKLGNLSEFLNDLASNPIELMKKLGNEVRFYDEGDKQWVLREYLLE